MTLVLRLLVCCAFACGLSNAQLPLSFEINAGQADARAGGQIVHLTRDGMRLSATGGMHLVGSSRRPNPVGEEPLPGRVNYLIGRDPSKWRTGVPTFAKVRYRGVYPGIDLVYYGNQRQLEFDFIVAPGADPHAIRMQFDSALRPRKPVLYQDVNGVRKLIAGDFARLGRRTVGFRVGAYDHSRPLVIDPVLVFSTFLGGSTANVANAVATDAAGNVYLAGGTQSPDSAFVAKLNASGTALIYSTYVGGTGGDTAYGLAVDNSGNAYFVGQTASKDFPATVGAFQTSLPESRSSFAAKLNATGAALIYATYLGGASNSYECCDAAAAVAFDRAGNAYVAGATYAAFFPVTPGSVQTKIGSGIGSNAFVTKLNPSGSALVYSTFLGGSGQAAFSIGPASVDGDFATALAVDSAGNAYVAGAAYSPNFPVTAGAFQTKNKAATTSGTVSPIPGFNAFVTKINPAGTALVFSTYLGGSGVTIPNGASTAAIDGDQANALAVDSAGNVYVAGFAYSADFPATTGAYQTRLQAAQATQPPLNLNKIGYNAFVTKLNPAGSALLYSTFVGGSGADRANALAIDAFGNAYIAGATTSTDFPVPLGAFQTVNKAAVTNNASSAFLTELNASGAALLNSTYLGGTGVANTNGPGNGDSAYGLALDAAGNVYLAGSTFSADFPATQGAYQTNNNAAASKGRNAFVAKLNLSVPPDGDTPSIRPNLGIVDAASYRQPLVPGGLGTIFGYDLLVTASIGSSMHTTTQLTVGGLPAPLLYVSPSQINFQVPWEVSGQTQATIVVTTSSGSSSAQANLSTGAPAIFTANASGVGQGAVVNAAGQIATAAAPATRGQYVMIFCTGLGAVSNQPATDAAASAQPLSNTALTPTVTIGGVQTSINFSGLAPGFVGLYQVNALVPATISPGPAVPVTLSIDGVSSNTVTIAVQ